MKSLAYLTFLFLSLICFYSCTSEDIPNETLPEVSLQTKALLNISYGEDSDQTFDLYLPAERTAETKTLILVHGGGWTSGDKADMTDLKNFLRSELPDIAVVNMNYRLADENNPPYPTQTNDITSVVNHLRENQEEYHIGSDLGFVGISAGGHLSLLWSYALDTNKKVKMVCSVVGPTNLLDSAYQNSDNEILQGLVKQFGSDNEILEQASPLFHVDASAPPSILFYGGLDSLVPISQGIDLDKKLTELEVEHEFTLYANEGHGWIGQNLFDTSIQLKAFIEKHL